MTGITDLLYIGQSIYNSHLGNGVVKNIHDNGYWGEAEVFFDSTLCVHFIDIERAVQLGSLDTTFLKYVPDSMLYTPKSKFRCQHMTNENTQCRLNASELNGKCHMHIEKPRLQWRGQCECGYKTKAKGLLSDHKNNRCLYNFECATTWVKILRELIIVDIGLRGYGARNIDKNKYSEDIIPILSKYCTNGHWISAKYLWDNPDEFYPKYDLDAIYCRRGSWSTYLQFRNHVLGRVDYYTYITSSEWKERSQRAKERAGYKCTVCNGRQQLATHHKTYERLGHELEDDLVVLCGNCHALFHGKLAKDKK